MNSLDLVELTPMGMPIEMLVSFTEIWNDKPLSKQILEVIKIAKIPDKNTAGSRGLGGAAPQGPRGPSGPLDDPWYPLPWTILGPDLPVVADLG